jgi:ATP/ADP translocase
MDPKASSAPGTTKDAASRRLCERILGLFTVVLPGEAPKALLLALDVFLLLLAYYLIKPVRNALLCSSSSSTRSAPWPRNIPGTS